MLDEEKRIQELEDASEMVHTIVDQLMMYVMTEDKSEYREDVCRYINTREIIEYLMEIEKKGGREKELQELLKEELEEIEHNEKETTTQTLQKPKDMDRDSDRMEKTEINKDKCLYYCLRIKDCEKYGIKQCEDCKKYCKDDSVYCSDECQTCERIKSKIDKAEDQILGGEIKQKKKLERVKEIKAEKTTGQFPKKKYFTYNERGSILNERFYALTYTASDMDVQYEGMEEIERQLIENFKKHTKTRCIGSIYVIEYTENLTPHLHGLLRITTKGLKDPKKENHSNPRYIDKNVIIADGKTYTRGRNGGGEKWVTCGTPRAIAEWIEYMKKYYVIEGKNTIEGKMEDIVKGWEDEYPDNVESKIPF